MLLPHHIGFTIRQNNPAYLSVFGDGVSQEDRAVGVIAPLGKSHVSRLALRQRYSSTSRIFRLLYKHPLVEEIN